MEQDRKKLEPYLSPLAVLALSFGYAVGWGAFVMPGTRFLPDAGPLGTLLGIVAGSLAMGVFALNYHRMIQRQPGPGGAVRFARKMFGEDHGFLVGWFLFLAYIAILWANATSIVLLIRYTLGDALQFGFHYQVAGFDVYFGEAIVPVAAVVACGSLCICSKRLVARLQMFFAFVLAASVAFFFAVAFLRHDGGAAAAGPAFSPFAGSSPFMQFLQIFAMMPWAFVGFEAIANSSEEFKFSSKRTFAILSAAIAVSAMVYAFLALLPTIAVPEGYATWADYIRDRPNLSGADAVCVFAATKKLFGGAGVALTGAAMLAGQLTGIFGAYVATSRLMYCLAGCDALPKWFGRLSRDADPKNAILFVMGASAVVPFLGRTAIGWPVDVSTVGAVLAYGYTSAAAFKAHAGSPGAGYILSAKAAGLAGVAISVALGLMLLVPTYLSGTTLEPEAYLLLAVWCILGFMLYRREFRLDRQSRFGHSIIVWISVIVMTFFSSLMWVRQSACDALDEVVSKFSATESRPAVERLEELMKGMDGELLADALVEMGLLVVTIVIMISLFGILRRREQTMAVEKTRAEEASRAKSFFFSTVSHDIRTPLNAIIGFSQMLKMGFKTEAERNEAVDSILVSGRTLLCLINDILDLSKLESGKMDIDLEPTPCRSLLKEIVDSFRVASQKPGLQIRGEIAQDLPNLMLDPQRVRQIAFNLMGNAAKFTHDGHIELRASFTPCADDPDAGQFRMDVEDTGCGISEEDLAKIATPYVQVGSKASRNGGTGLGLAICRLLARAMGGDLHVSSTLGKGSTFSVVIPRAKIAKEPVAATSTLSPSVDMTRQTVADGMRVLIADDQKMNILVLKNMLARIAKFEITTAQTGKEALDILTAPGAPKFDVLLTDMWMPEMDGSTLVKEVRGNPKIADLKVFVLTADVEMRHTYAETGFTGLVLKPVTFDNLRDIFATVCADGKGGAGAEGGGARASVASALALAAALFAGGSALADGAEAATATAAIAEEPARKILSFNASADVESAYICRGYVWDTRPYSAQSAEVEADFAPFGRVSAYAWSMSAMSGSGHSTPVRYAYNEIDYGLRYAYDWHITDDWTLVNGVAKQWVTNPGVRHGGHSLIDWQWFGALKNPYIIPYWKLRYIRKPYQAAYWCVGVKRAFELTDDLSLTVDFFGDLGDSRHFGRLFGPKPDDPQSDYKAGLHALSLVFRLDYALTEHIGLFAFAGQFCLVSDDARDAIKATHTPEARRDLTYCGIGAQLNF